MSISFDLRQITSVQTGPLYRVNNEITAAVDATTAVFVYKTETQVFSHYATVADLETYPDSRAQALTDGALYYRLASVTRDWSTVTEMEADVAETKSRLRYLASELNAVQAGVASDTTTTIIPE